MNHQRLQSIAIVIGWGATLGVALWSAGGDSAATKATIQTLEETQADQEDRLRMMRVKFGSIDVINAKLDGLSRRVDDLVNAVTTAQRQYSERQREVDRTQWERINQLDAITRQGGT